MRSPHAAAGTQRDSPRMLAQQGWLEGTIPTAQRPRMSHRLGTSRVFAQRRLLLVSYKPLAINIMTKPPHPLVGDEARTRNKHSPRRRRAETPEERGRTPASPERARGVDGAPARRARRDRLLRGLDRVERIIAGPCQSSARRRDGRDGREGRPLLAEARGAHRVVATHVNTPSRSIFMAWPRKRTPGRVAPRTASGRDPQTWAWIFR